ncbi:DEAD/DEAH box helicase [bacterium]|nr:MAG: DEAD/DEAH box helicase [bacterium]
MRAIQSLAIPNIMKDKDIFIAYYSGSGKTTIYLIKALTIALSRPTEVVCCIIQKNESRKVDRYKYIISLF